MSRMLLLSCLSVSVFLGLVLATEVRGLDPADVHEMVIYNGTARTVQFTGKKDLPLADRISLESVNLALNEMALQGELVSLRSQYVNDEKSLEARRRNVQQLLYGCSSTSNVWYYPGVQYPRYPWLYPFAYAPYGAPNIPALLNSVTYSLANGVGDEGRLKAELAHTLSSPAAAEAAAAARRSADAALARVGLSAVGRDFVVLKDGTRIEGKIVKEDPDWVTLDLGGPKEQVRMAEIVRIGRAK